MEAANNRMNLVDSGYVHGPPNGIHDATMATGGKYHQTFSLDIEASGLLMLEVIWH